MIVAEFVLHIAQNCGLVNFFSKIVLLLDLMLGVYNARELENHFSLESDLCFKNNSP